MLPPPRTPLFPYTTLFRSRHKHSSSSSKTKRENQMSLLRFGWAFFFSTCSFRLGHYKESVGHDSHASVLYFFCGAFFAFAISERSEEHTSELQSRENLVCS